MSHTQVPKRFLTILYSPSSFSVQNDSIRWVPYHGALWCILERQFQSIHSPRPGNKLVRSLLHNGYDVVHVWAVGLAEKCNCSVPGVTLYVLTVSSPTHLVTPHTMVQTEMMCPPCNGGTCDPTNGMCLCPPGFTGTDCSGKEVWHQLVEVQVYSV